MHICSQLNLKKIIIINNILFFILIQVKMKLIIFATALLICIISTLSGAVPLYEEEISYGPNELDGNVSAIKLCT